MVTTRSGKTSKAASPKKSSGTRRVRTCKYGKKKQYGGIHRYKKCPENKVRRAERQKEYRMPYYRPKNASRPY